MNKAQIENTKLGYLTNWNERFTNMSFATMPNWLGNRKWMVHQQKWIELVTSWTCNVAKGKSSINEYIYIWKLSKDSWGIFQQAMLDDKTLSDQTIKGTDPTEVKRQTPCQERRSKMQTAWKFLQGSWTWHGDFFGRIFSTSYFVVSASLQVKECNFWKTLWNELLHVSFAFLDGFPSNALPHNGCYSCSKRWHWLQSNIFHQSLHPFRDISLTVGCFC